MGRRHAVAAAIEEPAHRRGEFIQFSTLIPGEQGHDMLRGGRSASAALGRERPELVYEIDWNEEERLDEWREVLTRTEKMPGLVAAATAYDA